MEASEVEQLGYKLQYVLSYGSCGIVLGLAAYMLPSLQLSDKPEILKSMFYVVSFIVFGAIFFVDYASKPPLVATENTLARYNLKKLSMLVFLYGLLIAMSTIFIASYSYAANSALYYSMRGRMVFYPLALLASMVADVAYGVATAKEKGSFLELLRNHPISGVFKIIFQIITFALYLYVFVILLKV